MSYELDPEKIVSRLMKGCSEKDLAAIAVYLSGWAPKIFFEACRMMDIKDNYMESIRHLHKAVGRKSAIRKVQRDQKCGPLTAAVFVDFVADPNTADTSQPQHNDRICCSVCQTMFNRDQDKCPNCKHPK